jgi:hypothetical protein
MVTRKDRAEVLAKEAAGGRRYASIFGRQEYERVWT